VFRTIGHGVFHCPHESADRDYRLRVARRWFHIFWLPIVPLKQFGEIVECETCNSRYEVDVLRIPTAAAIADSLARAMRMSVIDILRASSAVSSLQHHAALAILRRYVPHLSDSDLRSDVTMLDTASLHEHLQHIAPVLNDLGKESLVGNCAWVAVADGALNSTGRIVLEQLGADLGMTPAHIRGVIDSVLESAVSRGNG
jgi:hypothetical protein